MISCPRCNKTSDSHVASSGPLFEGKYETVCENCADDIDYEVARRDYSEGLSILFTHFCHYPPDDPKILRQQRASRGLKKMGEIEEKRKKRDILGVNHAKKEKNTD